MCSSDLGGVVDVDNVAGDEDGGMDREVEGTVNVTNGFDGLGSFVDGSLDEMALAMLTQDLKKKIKHRWMLLLVSLLEVESQDTPHR